jgi:hypothetical protein
VVPNIAIMWNYEVWSELDAHIVRVVGGWRIYTLQHEREKNRMRGESYELGAQISKL